MVVEVTTTIRDVMDLGVSRAINVEESATGDVGIHSTTRPALHSVTNAAKSVCVCLQGIMGINKFVLATTIGRPRKEDPSALRNQSNHSSPNSSFPKLPL
ncbi:hypothetical protein Ddye_008224 [Dipteronia dyeriana]|uniref:Uncharacterized protein n=1 Tax=Dipteronia dyeriana TaxID=168575 RepID=A0AAD9X9E5_9ROSI|nr:hypothetical protein Ddye_008224 [Dipteronia dyeriana]